MSTNSNNSSSTNQTTPTAFPRPTSQTPTPLPSATSPLAQPQSSTSGLSCRRRKRSQALQTGDRCSYEDKDNDYVCAICFEIIDESHMTRCGHSFCFKCIKGHLELNNRCPKCNFVMEKPDQIFPNVLLNELILKHKQRQKEKRIKMEGQNGSLTVSLDDFLSDSDMMDPSTIDMVLHVLQQKKHQLEADCKSIQLQILKEFLEKVRCRKRQQLDQLNRELCLVEEDCNLVDLECRRTVPHTSNSLMDYSSGAVQNGCEPGLAAMIPLDIGQRDVLPQDGGQDGFNGSKNVSRHRWNHTTLAARRKRVYQHFDDLEQCYYSIRNREFPTESDDSSAGTSSGNLGEFTTSLSKFVRFAAFRPLATLTYASDIYNGSSIVSSIDFDRDCEYFAIAGVTKKIKVFEYGSVIRDTVDMHYPLHEMVCNSKISCITWNGYHKGVMASSDYEGTITLWDALQGVKSRLLQEHEKRCWSVDFNRVDPKLLASGSDDSKVKLWSTDTEHSVACLEAKANVCCVKFNPDSRFHLAFGSADHCVHYYDLRNPKQPVVVFKGHKKAVSYAKFVNSTELVSASTDSQLKLWKLNNRPLCSRTFRGHVNEKNFVGLASDGDYIACGSENNSLCVYYKGLSKLLLTFKFDVVRSLLEKDKKEDEANEFVSAVCWRPNSNVLVAANSQGIIKVLELV